MSSRYGGKRKSEVMKIYDIFYSCFDIRGPVPMTEFRQIQDGEL